LANRRVAAEAAVAAGEVSHRDTRHTVPKADRGSRQSACSDEGPAAYRRPWPGSLIVL